MMNWFEAQKIYSIVAVEEINRKLNLITRRAYGYRSYDMLKIALFHTLGHLQSLLLPTDSNEEAFIVVMRLSKEHLVST